MASSVNNAVSARLLKYLKSGRDITANQARARFGITNVSARVSELRAQGYSIYLNTRTTGNGRTIRAYRLGRAKRSVVRAGFLAQKRAANPTLASEGTF